MLVLRILSHSRFGRAHIIALVCVPRVQVPQVNRVFRELIRFCTGVMHYTDPSNSDPMPTGGYGRWWRCGPPAVQAGDKAVEDTWQLQRQQLLHTLSLLLQSSFEPKATPHFPKRRQRKNFLSFYDRCADRDVASMPCCVLDECRECVFVIGNQSHMVSLGVCIGCPDASARVPPCVARSVAHVCVSCTCEQVRQGALHHL